MAKNSNEENEVNTNTFGKVVKNIFTGRLKLILIIAIIVIFAVILLAGSTYVLKLIDGKEDSNNKKNAPAAIKGYTANTNIDKNGNISLEKAPKELWDELKTNNNAITKYINSAEELAKIMNVQLVTEYLYTGNDPENATVDTTKLAQNIDSKDVQGIVKLKRALSDGSVIYMKYKSPEEFQKLIDSYNNAKNNNERNNAKTEALKYFTLGENWEYNYTTTNSETTESTTSSETAAASEIQTNILHWPLPGYTNISSGFGPRESMEANGYTTGSFHYGTDIPAPQGTPIEAAADGIVDQVQLASEGKNGGNNIRIKHSDGLYTRYLHMNTAPIVKVGDTVQRGQVIGYVGKTGAAGGYHLHFSVVYGGDNNWSNAINPITCKYDNGIGSGTTAITVTGNSLASNSNMTKKYIARVAKFTETLEKCETNDPSVEEYSKGLDYMTTQDIDYKPYLSKYTMPFNYLWSMLLIGEDKDFVFDIADLVYNSKFEITVRDNVKTTTDTETSTYKNKTEYKVDNITISGHYTVKDSDGTPVIKLINERSLNGGSGERYLPGEGKDYFVKNTTVYTDDTLDIGLTLADCWFVKYEEKYTYSVPETQNTPSNVTKLDDFKEKTETKEDDPEGLAKAVREKRQKHYESLGENVSTRVSKSTTTYNYWIVDRKITTEFNQQGNQYTNSPAETVEKTDKNSVEPNFVTLFCNNYNARSNILSAESWLYKILESNEDTKDMVDLTKYLFQSATGKDYGLADFNTVWNKYLEGFSSLGQIGSGIGGTQGQIYDFLLAKGVPAIGAASILGNVEDESSFNPALVNEIGASGLCQWYQGRFENLKKFATTKGTDWTDVNTQMEFLWQEINSSYTNVRDIIMSADEESELEYATWYWGTYFEKYDDAQFVGYEASRNREIEQRRYKYAQKWYKEWQEKHTTLGIEGIVTLGGISTQSEADQLTNIYNNMLNTQIHSDTKAYQTGPFEKWWTKAYVGGLSKFQCTWWANGRASMYLEKYGTKYKKYPTLRGNGGEYYRINIENGWFNYGRAPKPNSIVSMTTTGKWAKCGHVAYVEGVTNEGIWISDAGGGDKWHGVRFMSYEKINKRLIGYVYLDEPK